jgi:hypothetical protein
MTTMVATTKPTVRFPSAPLLRAIDEHMLRVGGSRRRALGDSGRRAWWRARADGTVTPFGAAHLCRLIGVDPHDLYGDAFQEPAARQRGYEPTGQSVVRLPAWPLLEAIDRRAGKNTRSIDQRHPDRTASLHELLGLSGTRMYHRALRDGTVTLHTIEQFCDLLGWHPYQLYGPAYEEAAFAGTPDDFDPWAEVA